jgi:hypothetical protein
MRAGVGTDRTLVSSIMCARCPALCACCPSDPAPCSGSGAASCSGTVSYCGLVSHCGTASHSGTVPTVERWVPRRHGIPQRHGISQRDGIPYGTLSHICTVSTVSHCGLVSHGGTVSFGMGSIVVYTPEVEQPTEAASARDRQGTCHASPRMPNVLVRAARTTECGCGPETRRRRTAERCSGRGEVHGCGGSKRGSLRASMASATWPGENRGVRCCTARSLVARPSSRRARERAMAWGRRRRKPRAARRAMKRATIDEATELSSARHGGATECGTAAAAGCHGGRRALRPPVWIGARGQGWAFGLNVLSAVRGWFWGNPTTNKTAESCNLDRFDQRGMRQPRCAPSPACICIGLSWEGSHNSISRARRSL